MKTTPDWQAIANEINRSFGTRFGFPSDFVHAHVPTKGGLAFKIGNRDIQLYPNGTLVGSGTDLTQRWKIDGPFEVDIPVPTE